MRKISMFMMALMLLLSTTVFGQLSGTKNIPGDYATLTAAIADLNTQGVGAGGVTFSLLAGYTETFATPTAGLITATGTAGSPIIFMKNGAGANPVITAATGVSTTVDGIIVIKGGDYISFYNIDLSENSANVTATTQMEWGYAILKASATDGAKNINISNCTVILNKTNVASVGIYANNHTDANTTLLTIADVLGTNQNIHINGNTINNCYQGIYVKGFTTTTYYDSGLEIGSTSGNVIANYGGAATATNGIYVTGQTAPKIENNNVTLATGTTTTAYGINVATACIGDLTINLNTISVSSSATTSMLAAINNAAPIATVVNITNNTIENCNYMTATSGNFYGIYEQGATTGCTVNITSNIVRNTSLGSLITTGSGTLYSIYVTSGSPTAVNVNNNMVTGNIISGTTGGSIYGIYINKGTTQTANTNSIYDNSIVGTGTSGSFYGIRSVTGTVIHNLNSIYNNSIAKATATSGVNYGIYNFASPTNETYNSNSIYNLTSQGTNTISAIYVSTAAGTRTIANNTINELSSNGTVYGLYLTSSSTSAYKNRIFNLSGNGASSLVYGIYLSSGVTNTVYNNFVSDLKAPAANLAMAIAGIYVAGGTTANLYYNTIYLNASSSGALFGTAGIYASTTPTVDMRNNIIANTSTPMGATGYTAAYRRSTATMTTYAATSNNNCFYAGTPGANNVIYYDGTTPYINFVDIAPIFGTRDNISFSVVPPFVNIATAPYDLKLQAGATTMCESGGQRITTPAITDDFEGTLRFGEVGYADGGTGTDVGADEFIGIPVYTCAAPAPGNTVASANALCFGASTVLSLQNTTAGTGVSYQWQSSIDDITYTNGPTTATWTVTPTVATYYKCVVTCINGPVSGTSTPVQITFAQAAPTTTPGARCGTGVVTLAAAGSGTLSWYTAATGGTSIFTGSPYNANVSATTTYYVSAENSAPANITLGLGAFTNTGFESPFNHTWGGMKSQYLVKASELIAAGLSAGNITALSFNVAVAGTAYNTFNLSMGSTALTALTTTIQTGLSSVYSAASVTPTAGVFTITFGTPYAWDGTSNIIVETCWSNNNTGGTGTTVKYDNSTFVATSYYRADGQTAAVICAATTATATLSTRPQMIFAGQSTCSSPRTAVIATVNTAPELTVSADQTVCNDAIAAISVTSPLANYDTYVWTPAAGLFTDAAATVPYVDGASATTLYAKTATASVTNFVCLGSNALLCAKTDTVVITVLPAMPTISAVSSPLCVTGTSALNVTPATGYGAATFQWNISTDNVTFAPISGHITLNDVTDVITATTYYKLTIKNGAGATCTEPTVSVVVVNPSVASTTPATRCGIGSVTVGATGSADVTLNWYKQATGGVSIGTGTSFTTTVGIDTNFYVEAVSDLLPTCKSARSTVHVTVTPAPVLTLSAAQTVCNNAIATISVTSTLADYDTYVWTPAANLFTDAAATVPYVAGASATTVYLKSTTSGANVVTCSASNAALCANIATTTVNVRTAINITAAATPASICAGGTANLDATVNQVYTSHLFSSTTGTYTPLVGGTASTATGDDGTQLNIPIGFNFTHNGNVFTTFGISTNGTIQLGATATSFTNSLVSFSNVMAPMWDDNNLGAGSISYLVTGTSPNQVLTVEWNNVAIGGGGSSSNSTNQYQVQLFEGSNNIQFNYGNLSPNSLSASIGISKAVGQFFSVTPSAIPTVSSTTENNTISSVANIPSGTSYLFATNTPVYSYSWKAGATEIATTLSTTVSPANSTDYTFSVVDANACSVTSPIVSVSVNPVLIALVPVGVTCNGGNDGSFTEGAITCGVAPFTYSVDGGAYGAIPTNLIAGPHTIIVKDAGLNLSAPMTLTIGQPSPVEIPTVSAPMTICQGTVSAAVTATTGSIVVPFNVTVQPIETQSAPGNIVATATLPAIPVGSTITNVTLSYPGITPNGGSWQSDVRLGLTGAITDPATVGTGAANTSVMFDYTRILTTPTIDLAGGIVNLLYWDNWNDVSTGADATFPLGTGVATLTITYTPAATITWYDAATGGAVVGVGSPLETVGTTVLPNTNTPGTYNFYAEGGNGTCVSPTRALVSVTVSAPSVGGTATGTLDAVCSGTGTSILLTGSTGSIQWQSSTDGTTWSNVAGETTATLATGNLTAKTYYQAVVTSGTCASTVSTIDSVEVIANSIPGSINGGGLPVCSNANSTLLTLVGYTGTITGWESSLDGTTWTPIANTTDTYTATNLTATTQFRAIVANGICSNYSTVNTITVTPIPTAVIAYANDPFCSSSVAENATLVGTVGGVYSSTTGLTIDASTGAINPSTSTAGDYVVTYTIAAAGGCAVVSDDTTITITQAPTAAISYAAASFLNDITTPQAVTLVGTTGGVYSSTAGLTINASTGAIIPSTSTVGNYIVTYTIAAAGGCGIVTATANVEITAPATCDAPTALVVSAINLTGASLSWTNGGTETAWNIRYKKTGDATYTNVNNTTTKPYILSTLQSGSTYVWNVQAVCSSTLTSAWSIDNTFTTTTGIESNAIGELNVYSLNNQVNVINNGKIFVKEVIIYDVIGKEVARYAINSFDNILINTNFSVASYVVKIVTNDQVGTYKLFIK